MKIKNKILAFLLAICLIFGVMSPALAAEETQSQKSCRILFTHDLHSHLLSYKVQDEAGNVTQIGGFARLATLIKENKTDTTFLLDGGDYSMGSLFNCLFETAAPELNLMAAMGYDATTLGNHDFDYGLEGLAKDLAAATDTINHPALIASNIIYGDDDASQRLENAMQLYGALETKIIARNGVKIGVFGLLGEDAQNFTDSGSLTFKDTAEAAAACVETLEQQGADVIVCLSHSGTDEDPEKSEDELLAQNVDGIDVILSAHTHTTLETPICINDTLIVSAGCYGANLGVLDLTIDATGKVALANYELKATTPDVQEDESINQLIASYKNLAQAKYLTGLGKNFDDVILTSSFTTEKKANTLGNHNIQDLIADAYMYEAEQKGIDADFSMITAGLVRDAIYEGDTTESDIFSVLSLGQSDNGDPGYALVDAYISGETVNTLCQLDVIADLVMPEAHMGFSGLRYTYSNDRLPLDKVTSVEIQDENGNWQPVEDDQMYHIITSQYNADMINTINDLTKGIIKLTFYDAQGNEYAGSDDAISRDADGNALQEWVALSDYCHSFEKNAEGVSVLPESYATARETKTLDTTTGFFENPSHYGKLIYTTLIGTVVVLILIIFFIVLMIKLIKRSKKQKRLGNKL